MAKWIPQPSFAKGEISPTLYGRFDLEAYSIGAKVIENFLVTRAGGLVNTPGSEFIGEVKDSSARTRLIPFQFNTVQTYVLEFGNLYMRVIKDGAYVLDGSGNIYEITTPYTTADLTTLKYMQSNDVMTLTHKSYAQHELTRTDHDAWTLSTPTYAPDIAAPAITASSFSTAETGATYSYVATAVDETTLEESLPSSQRDQVGPTDANWSVGEYLSLSGTCATTAKYVNIYKNKNGIFGFIGQCVPSSGSWSFTDDKIDPDTLDAPQEQKDPFTGTGNYPQCATYYEQRVVFGGSSNRPQGLDMSQSGQYHNFNISTPYKADDAISRDIAAQQVNEIRHFVPIRELLVLTSGGVWKISAGGSTDVVTPDSISVRMQTHRGVSNVQPIIVGETVLYIEEQGTIVRDMGYQFAADNYVGEDISVISSHIFENREIDEWAYARAPYSIVWAVLDNGTMATMTYMKEQQLVAWTRQVTDGAYESVATIQEGNETAVYCVVKRTIGGNTKRYVERFKSRTINDQAVDDAFFVDSGLTLDTLNATSTTMTLSGGTDWTSAETLTMTASASTFASGDVGKYFDLLIRDTDNAVTARARVKITAYTSDTVVSCTPSYLVPDALRGVATTVWGYPVNEVSGLDHLEGEVVDIVADGNVMPTQTVTSGTVSLTQYACKAHVGMHKQAELETLPVGDTQGGVAIRKKIVKVRARINRSRGMWAGPDRDNMTELKRDPLWSPELRTEEVELAIMPETKEQSTVVIQQRDPMPLSILAVIADVDS